MRKGGAGVRGEIYGEARRERDYGVVLLVGDVNGPYKGLLPALHLDAPSNYRDDKGSVMQRVAYLPPVVPMPMADLNES